MYHLLRYIFIIFSISQTAYCSYHYAGCYTQVFHDSYYTSSFMEPTLCFRLCDTPVIYLQKTVCRCSGGGLMHYNRQPDDSCKIPCTKPVDRSVKAVNTCGGPTTYSAYVQEKFYSQHGHLFNYQIEFNGCELWKSGDVYDTVEVKLNAGLIRSSLNTLERCAAACLDKNSTTKSIAFNGNSDKCLCIMPLKPSKIFDRAHYIELKATSFCDSYCNNTAEGSKTDVYKCGSLKDAQIWAVYDLNVSFVYDGSTNWTVFLNIINGLKLNDSIITIDFDESVIIDRSWKCLSSSVISTSDSWRTYYSQSRSTLYGWSTGNTRYILENGCLRESSYSSYSHRYSYRLCVTDPINKYASISDENSTSTYIAAINPQTKFCPTNWFDLNGRCYRISDQRKTIDEARNNCIDVSTSQSNTADKPRIWVIDSNGHIIGGDELNDSPKGEIVEYISQWQARLGFFLLDTDPDNDNDNGDTETTTPIPTTVHNLYYDDSLVSSDTNETVNTDHGAINEFHLLDINENKNTSIKNNTCVIITRSISEEEEKPIINNRQAKNCTTPRHVLCGTDTLVVQNFQYGCFSKPKTFDLPALISEHLTHELCLSVCQELQTKLAILQINKCYCINGASPSLLNITTNFQQFKQKACGNACPGNPNELCGDEDTIVAFQILDPRRTYTFSRTPAEPFPNYVYDSCLRLPSINETLIYKFTINDINNIHPRYCVALCTKYEQKYALMNNKECLCTNIPVKNEESIDELANQNCPQQCSGNYFYSCGNKDNSTLYSMYILQPKCRHGFEVAENEEQCVYSHYSAKQNSFQAAQTYCQAIGSTLAKINNIVEIQDILPDSILHTRLMQQLLVFYKFKFVNDTRYYWIDRTTDSPDPKTVSTRALKQCSKMPDTTDKNCIAIQYVQNSEESKIIHERCIIESNECSVNLAMPVCVDQHIEAKPTIVPPISDDNPADVSVNATVDHTCGDDNEYHLIDDNCYKITFHEVSWSAAKSECQRDNAVLFIPEKSVALQNIKYLYLRRRSYSSSGFAHVGVYYDNSNRTVIQSNISNDGNDLVIPDSNAIYDLCEKTFQERYTALMLSTSLTSIEKAYLKKQQIGCAYIDLVSSNVPTIRCDEIPCNRTATVICQKLPKNKTNIIQATRIYVDSTKISDVTISTKIPTDDQSMSSTTAIASDVQSQLDSSQDETKSVVRNFAPIFFLLTIVSSLLLLALINTIYNHRNTLFRHSPRRNINSVYSQLTSANEFDLN